MTLLPVRRDLDGHVMTATQSKSPESKSKRPHLAAIVGAFVFSAAAFAIEVMTIRDFVRAVQIQYWPTTEGIVTHSELIEEPGIKRRFEARVEYDFEVAGRAFNASGIRTRGTGTEHRFVAQSTVDAYPIGKQVTVYFDEANPGRSYLEAGPDWLSYFLIISPLVFCIVCVAAGRELWITRRAFDASAEGSHGGE